MSNIVQKTTAEAIEFALIKNDLSLLTTEQKLSYYNRVCESVGLNPLTQPLKFLKLNGREVLYAGKECTEQLRKIHGVSIEIVEKSIVGDYFEVHVRAKDKTGRSDEEIASIFVGNLKGDALINSKLKALTKAKRRATLSICGLGFLDESELDTISEDAIEVTENPQIPNPFVEEQKQIEAQDNDPGEYIVKGGRFSGKKLNEISTSDLSQYVDWVNKSSTGKPMNQGTKDFLFHAELVLKARELDDNPPATQETE